jgi:dual specificity tyrosine-phosphorylation-regulated kinase 2/3/4
MQNSKGKIKLPNSKELDHYLGSESETFLDFVKNCITWTPEGRLDAPRALVHDFILEGLPSEVLY